MRVHLAIRRLTLGLVAMAALSVGTGASAQQIDPTGTVVPGADEFELVDQVVAVVGDSAIFYSQVQDEIEYMVSSGTQVPQEPDALRAFEREVIGSIVDRSLLIQAAARDTLISIPDERIEERVDLEWDRWVQSFGSEAGLRDALAERGMTPADHRTDLRQTIRRNLLLESYMQLQRQQARPTVVEESEIRTVFEQEREQFAERPATIRFEQVIVVAQPSDSARTAAREEAQRLLERIRAGEDFADIARRFSDDPGSAARGGELGWLRRGTLVPEFEQAAFSLGRREMSPVVDSEYGAHIIRVDRIDGGERFVYHILIAAEPQAPDVEAARARAAEIRDQVAGGAPISDFRDPSGLAPLPDTLTLPRERIAELLPSGFVAPLAAAQEGDVLGPIEFPTQRDISAFSIIAVREVRESGEFDYEDARGEIRNYLQQRQFEERLVDRLRASTYVDIRW